MKKSILILVCMFFAISASSQVTWNVKTGMNISNWNGEYNDSDAKIGFRIGGGMEYAFSKMWSIQPSLLISTKGAKGGEAFNGAKASLTVNQIYLEMPILGAVRFKIGNSTNLVLSAGPYMAYGVGGKMKVKASYQGESMSVDWNTFGKSDKVTVKANGETHKVRPEELDMDELVSLRRFDAGLATGVSFEFNRFILGTEFQAGFVPLTGDTDAPTNVNISVVFGYKF